MAQYVFGAGFVIGKRTDVLLTPVAFFGAVQDWSFDIDQKLAKLMGQYKDPVDVAPAERDVTGKIKFGQLRSTMFGNLLLGINPTAASGIDIIGPENRATGTTSFTVANGGTFTEDLGVYYHATGVALTPVASAPATGQYVAGVASVGTYTMAAGDNSTSLDFFYQVSTTSQFQMTVGQQLMGVGPVCELNFTVPYTVEGVAKKYNIQFPAVRIGKSTNAFKNNNYMIPELDFTAFSNASGTLMTWALSE